MAGSRHRSRSPGLPLALERRLIRRTADTPFGRVKAAAAIRAAGVLVRRHPGAVAEALGAGLVRAGRVGVGELRQWLEERGGSDGPRPDPPAPEPPAPRLVPWRRPRLDPADRRRLMRFLKEEARRARHAPLALPAPAAPAGDADPD